MSSCWIFRRKNTTLLACIDRGWPSSGGAFCRDWGKNICGSSYHGALQRGHAGMPGIQVRCILFYIMDRKIETKRIFRACGTTGTHSLIDYLRTRGYYC